MGVSAKSKYVWRGMKAGMRRYFNTEGQCEPEIHYMVGLGDKIGRAHV